MIKKLSSGSIFFGGLILLSAFVFFFLSQQNVSAQSTCALQWPEGTSLVNLVNPIQLSVGNCQFSGLPGAYINNFALKLGIVNIGPCVDWLSQTFWREYCPGSNIEVNSGGVRINKPDLVGPSDEWWNSGILNINIAQGYPDIPTQDTIIDYIARNGNLKIQVGTNTDPDRKEFTVPATNCVKLSGDGPIKVVFMRGKTQESRIDSFVSLVESYTKMFASISPLKEYLNNFSFYIDLKKIDELTLPRNGKSFSQTADSLIKSKSSCNNILGNNVTYIYTFGGLGFIPAWTGSLNDVIYINGFNVSDVKASTVIHEYAHALAYLDDEYYKEDSWRYSRFFEAGKNCTIKPSDSFRSSIDNKLYGGLTYEGCWYEYNLWNKLYRPSDNSLMNNSGSTYSKQFNVISCGYIITAIKGESLTKANAQKYWPECMKMDTVKEGIPAPNLNTPTIRAAP